MASACAPLPTQKHCTQAVPPMRVCSIHVSSRQRKVGTHMSVHMCVYVHASACLYYSIHACMRVCVRVNVFVYMGFVIVSSVFKHMMPSTGPNHSIASSVRAYMFACVPVCVCKHRTPKHWPHSLRCPIHAMR